MKSLLKLSLVFLIIISGISKTFAQADVWFLGNNISIDFSSGTAVAGTGIIIGADLTEGSTSITDANGNLLFAVVGDNIYDGGKNSVKSLGAGTWDVAQGSMIIPIPGTTNQYYLTVLKNGGGASTKPMAEYYRITANGTGAGNLTITGPDNLAANLTQSQTGVPKLNPDGSLSSDFWYISHELCNNNFKVFTANSSGINFSHNSSTGPNFDCISTWPPKYDDIGTLKFNGCYTQATYVMGDKVMLFDFDAKTGQFTHVATQTTGLSSAYSMEFSPDGKFAYVITGQDNNNPGHIYRMSVSPSGFGAPVSLGTTGGMRGGHLQLGPDGNIYFAAPQSYGNLGTGYIGRITSPNTGGVVDKTWYKAAAENNNTSDIEGQAVNMDMPNFLKSLVVASPKLLVDGVELSKTSVCKGDNVTLTVQVSGAQVSSVDWVATGANSGTQSGSATFSMLMANSGTTNVTATITDECGRERDQEFIIEVEDYQNANGTLATCPSRIVTGTGSTSGQYAWYTADPKSGGAFLGYGATYDADGLNNIWVQPVGNLTQTNVVDTRTAGNFGSATGSTTVTLAKGSGQITSFNVGTYTWQTYNGNLTLELRDASNNLVGTPVSKALSGSGEKTNIFSPTDWNINDADGPYSINVTSTANASFGVLSSSNYTSGDVSFSGGRASSINVTTYDEGNKLKCFTGKLIPIPPCCTQLPPVVSGADTVCVGTTVTLTATKDNATANPVTFQWYDDNGPINGATSATYNVPTNTHFNSKEYWATVTSSPTCAGESPISNKIRVQVNPNPTKPTITINPNETEFCEGTAYTLTAASTVATGTVQYQWKLDGTSNTAVQNGLTTPATYDYRVVVNALGCQDSLEQQIIVNPFDEISLTVDTIKTCSDGAIINLNTYRAAGFSAGTWSGTGVTGTNFNPNIGAGNYKVKYTTSGSCPKSDSLIVSVTDKLNLQFNIQPIVVCADTPVFNISGLTNFANLTGGDFWGFGIDATADATGKLGVFDASKVTPGTDLIYYGVQGACGDTVSLNATVNALDVLSLTADTIRTCSDGAVINLDDYITGGSSAGTWSGTGITGSNFDPTVGAGNYKVKYTTNGSCNTSDSLVVVVTDKINLQFAIPPIAVCADAPALVITALPLNVNVPGGKFWGLGIDHTVDTDSTLGVFDASKATPGTGLLYYGIAGACGDTTSLNVTINPLDTAAILPPPSFCNSDPVTRLQLNTTVSTAGGTWSGISGSSYIAANGDFNPAGLSEGLYKVYYTTPGACSYRDSAEVEISNFVSYQITTAVDAGQTYKSFCITDPITPITVNINGGVYWTKSGNGLVTQNGTNNNFNPTGLIAGTDTIFYGKAGDCGDTTFLPIVILPMDIAVIATGGVAKDTSVCVDNAAFNLRISSNSTTGGVWSGTGITNGANGTFNPATAGVGVHKIFYNTNGGGNRCDVRDSMLITVIKRAIPTFNVSADAFCGSGVAKQYTVAEAGGTFTSDLWGAPGGNAYTLVNPTTIEFNPVTAGPGIDSIFYTIGGQCGAQDTLIIGVAADDVAEIDVTSAGPFCQTDAESQLLLTNNSTTGGFWTNGAGVNVNTYINAAGQFNPQHPSISTTNLNRVIYHTTGICPKKDTVMVSVVSEIITNITQNDTLRLCIDGATVPLTLSNNTTPNGTWSSTPTTIVNNAGVVNPALGTPGTYKIKYAVYGGTATCADSDSVFVRILPRMDASIVSFANTVNKDTTICQGSGAFNLRALNTGGTWSGTGVNTTTGEFNPSGLNPGTYTVKHTIQGEGNLCPDEKEVRVVIRPQVNINLASTMNDVCQGSPAFDLTQRYSPSPDTGRWFILPGNPALAITNASLGTINPTVAGAYTVHYGIADLCGDTSSVSFNIIEVVDPAIANNPTAPVCIGEKSIDFNPVNTTTAGVWTVNNGGVIDANTGVMDIEASGAGTYSIIHTITTTGNGVSCPTTATTNLTVEDYLLANINAAGPFCENLPGQQLNITGVSGGTWGGAANSSGVFDPQFYGPGTHEVTYRLQNACDTTYRREIQVSGVPNTRYEIVNDNPTNCEPLTVTFRDQSGSPVNSTRWVLSTGETILANSDLEVTFMAGVYYAGMIQDYQNGCKDTLVLNVGNGSIDVDAVPYADFEWTPFVPNAKNPNVQFQNLSNNGSAYEWTFDVRTATPNFSTEFQPFINYNAPDGDTTEVCLRVINGSCATDTCKTLIIINNLTVFMPTAFTPNGDNLNDVFYPMGKFHDNQMGSENYRFWVFNRWGQEIFYTETPYAGWDGKYLNDDVQQDVYVWRIEVFNPETNKTETHVGQVTLYR